METHGLPPPLRNMRLRMTRPYGGTATEGPNICFDERLVNHKSIRAAGVKIDR